MDIYQPKDDTLLERPAIIFIHSGAFFTGSNEAQDMVALSQSAAKRGYVAISSSYRLGPILSILYKRLSTKSCLSRCTRYKCSPSLFKRKRYNLWNRS